MKWTENYRNRRLFSLSIINQLIFLFCSRWPFVFFPPHLVLPCRRQQHSFLCFFSLSGLLHQNLATIFPSLLKGRKVHKMKVCFPFLIPFFSNNSSWIGEIEEESGIIARLWDRQKISHLYVQPASIYLKHGRPRQVVIENSHTRRWGISAGAKCALNESKLHGNRSEQARR